MRKAYSALFLIFIVVSSFSQSGTIKIAKPVPQEKKDTVIPKSLLKLTYCVGSNYSFRETGKFGYEAELAFTGGHPFIAIKYCHENEFYLISPYNREAKLPAPGYSRSETESDFIKLSIGFNSSSHLTFGDAVGRSGQLRYFFAWAVTPEFRLKTTNQYGRLENSDFSPFNISTTVTLGFPIIRKYIRLNFSYTWDFANNLKDKNIYNELGTVMATQRTKTQLFSVGLSYTIFVNRNNRGK